MCPDLCQTFVFVLQRQTTLVPMDFEYDCCDTIAASPDLELCNGVLPLALAFQPYTQRSRPTQRLNRKLSLVCKARRRVPRIDL